jgi:ribosome-associated protein
MSNLAKVYFQSALSSPRSTVNLDPSVTSRDLAFTIAAAADDRKGANIVILRVSEVSYLADYFIIVTGFSNVQVRAIAGSIEGQVEQKYQRYPVRTEGQSEGSWVLQDYGDVMVHVFMPEEREFYNLEAFWGHGERIEFPGVPLAQG